MLEVGADQLRKFWTKYSIFACNSMAACLSVLQRLNGVVYFYEGISIGDILFMTVFFRYGTNAVKAWWKSIR